MPGKGTPPRAIRINDDLWGRVKDAAAAHETNTSHIVRTALEAWLDGPELTDGRAADLYAIRNTEPMEE